MPLQMVYSIKNGDESILKEIKRKVQRMQRCGLHYLQQFICVAHILHDTYQLGTGWLGILHECWTKDKHKDKAAVWLLPGCCPYKL